MPVYTYICKDCGNRFDLLIGMTSTKPELKCRKCNSQNIEKVLSGFGIGGSGDSSSSGPVCSSGTCPTCF
ncbi:MAG: zinc ribbon domain-containing protein [Candidatus Susulua stagnicola]|nr:zinc ribbon domain-containing protein [Candidatus Susulua stagnicola]